MRANLIPSGTTQIAVMTQLKNSVGMSCFTVCLILILTSCSHNIYTATNKVYKKQARAFAKELLQQPASVDSAPAPPIWVGTTNFGLRKPNFVIIHHTAQNACDSTLRTFTLVRTQVSAHYVICKNGTIHHNVAGHHGAARVIMSPAPRGTGIIAGGPMRAVFEVMGITDIVAKSHGSTNPYNMVRATLDALRNAHTPSDVAAKRGKSVEDIFA